MKFLWIQYFSLIICSAIWTVPDSSYTASRQESFHRHTATSSADGSEVDCEGERELFDFCAVPFGEMAFRAWILVMAPQQKKKTNGSFRHVLLHQDLTWRSGGRVSQSTTSSPPFEWNTMFNGKPLATIALTMAVLVLVHERAGKSNEEKASHQQTTTTTRPGGVKLMQQG